MRIYRTVIVVSLEYILLLSACSRVVSVWCFVFSWTLFFSKLNWLCSSSNIVFHLSLWNSNRNINTRHVMHAWDMRHTFSKKGVFIAIIAIFSHSFYRLNDQKYYPNNTCNVCMRICQWQIDKKIILIVCFVVVGIPSTRGIGKMYSNEWKYKAVLQICRFFLMKIYIYIISVGRACVYFSDQISI